MNQIAIMSGNKKKNVFKTAMKKKSIYIMMLPGLIYFIIFKYLPMFGIIIAFKDLSYSADLQSLLNAPWVGFKHFINFFQSYYFWSILKNTILIHILTMMVTFPAPIIFALLLNEIRSVWFKKAIQTISYMPHFLSMVVVAAIVTSLLSINGGLVNEIVKLLGGTPTMFLSEPKYFRLILVLTALWQSVGWSSILYIAAITKIDVQLYEAATVDGATRFQKMWYITIPELSFIMVLNLILSIGSLLDAGFDRVLLLYSPVVYEVGDIIDTFVYRKGLIELNYAYSTAVGVFKSIVALILLIISDRFAKRFGQRGIW